MKRDNQAYSFGKYVQPERWASYWHQLNEVLKLEPESVLEIGVGGKVIGNYLKNNTKIIYSSLDLAEELQPDAIGSIENMPFKNKSFDLVCAFEVLEHLPFDRFPGVLSELNRVSRKWVVISLPHWGRHFAIDIRLPLIKRIKAQIKFSIMPPQHNFNGEHHWEIGKRNYPLKLIKEKIKAANFDIIKDYIAFDSPYHHFFVLKKCAIQQK